MFRFVLAALFALALVVPARATTPLLPPCRILPPQYENGVYFAHIVEALDDGEMDPYTSPGTYIYASTVVSYTARYDEADRGVVGPTNPYVMGYFSSPVDLWASEPFVVYLCLPQREPGVRFLPLLALPASATPPTSQSGHS